MFDTYGPFELERHDQKAFGDLFEQIQEAEPRLQYGIGVYIVCAKDATGGLIPWYVGRTWNEFGSRLVQHFKNYKFKELMDEHGALTLFLLPRATPGGRLKVATEGIKENGLRSIRQLELMLIGTCLKLNPLLMNKKDATFHRTLHVAGYLDNGPSDRNFPAAEALSKLLKT